jgi:hypothetical protein
MQTPNSAVQGVGLHCCHVAGVKFAADRKRRSVIDRLRNDLDQINPNLVWVGGEYKNQNSPLLMRCKKTWGSTFRYMAADCSGLWCSLLPSRKSKEDRKAIS